MTTLIRAGVLAVLLAIASPVHADTHPEDVPRFEPISRGNRHAIRETLRERAEAHDISTWLLHAIGNCESNLDPDAIGRQGEKGLMQLAPFGLLPLFYQKGYTDPWSVYQQADFTAWAISNGLAGHWSCYYIVTGQRPPWWN